MAVKSHYNNWIWFIGLAFTAVLVVYGIRLMSSTPTVTKVDVSVTIPADSIAASEVSKRAIHTLDSLSKVIGKQEEELHQYYGLFLKARQDDADMMKILSIIGALIIAFGTFFGIRNMKDFKDNITVDAQQAASDTARSITENITKSSLKSTVSSEIMRSLDNDLFYRDMKSRIQDDIVSTILPNLEEEVKQLKKEVASLAHKPEVEEDPVLSGEEDGDEDEPITPIPDVSTED